VAVVYYKYSIHYGCGDVQLLLRAGVLACICHLLMFVISQNPLYRIASPLFFFPLIQESTHLGIFLKARDLLTVKISLKEDFQ